MNLWGIINGLLVQEGADRTKQLSLIIDPSATTGTRTTIKVAQTANRTITMPDSDFDFNTTLTEASVSNLTNKTIDGNFNTLSNIDISALKPVLIDAGKFLVRDGSGAVVSSVVSFPASAIVGVSDIQVLSNKSFSDAITASNLSGTNTGDLTLAAVGSTPDANGATLVGQVLTLQPADATHPGLINIGTQTFGGAKTFSTSISSPTVSATTVSATTVNSTSASATNLLLNGSTSGTFTLHAADTTASYSAKMPNAQGTARTILQNDGSGNLSWKSYPSIDFGLAIASTTFTTPSDTTTNTVFKITCIGGGGSGGSGSGSVGGGGGGSGGMSVAYVNGHAAGEVWTLTCGAGGSSAGSGGVAGNAGGNTTVVFGSTLCRANGGGGGNTNASGCIGGAGANITSAVGNLTVAGSAGGNGTTVAGVGNQGGMGAQSFLGGGGQGGFSAITAGGAGTKGGGGGGSQGLATGAGGTGAIIIEMIR